MEILIRGNKVDITDSMKSYVKEKLGRLDKYMNTDNVKATVLVKIRNFSQKVEVTIPLKTLIIRAEEEQNDFYSAIDLVVAKIEKQIRKNKSKLQRKEKRGTKELRLEEVETASIVKEDEDTNKIVKVKKIDIKPMDKEEAILQMELLGHNFYVFKDSEDDKICVIYKRKEEGYGLIETE